MLVVDTNILVYLLLSGDRTAEARLLFERDGDWHSEEFVLAEFTNVLATNARLRRLTSRQAAKTLVQAQDLMKAGLHRVGHEDVLALALRHEVSAYDARFLGVAGALGTRLVTEDARLRHAAPEQTQSLSEALGD